MPHNPLVVYNVFHILILRKSVVDLHVIGQPQGLEAANDVTYIVIPKQIVGRDTNTTHRTTIEMVKCNATRVQEMLPRSCNPRYREIIQSSS